jgi:hypothetical protein
MGRRESKRAIRGLTALAAALSWFAVEPAVASAHTQQVEPPVFVEEPQDRVTNEGATVEFRAAATGTGWLELVFQRSVDGGDTWMDVGGCGGDGDGVCATQPTATLDLDGSLWRAVVTGAGGTTISREALLRVCSEATCATDDFVVSPSSDLVSGQVVQVTGSGFPGSAPIYLSTCEVDSRLCTNGLLTTTDATGTLATPYTVQRTIAFRRDCLRTACELRAELVGGSEAVRLASSPVAFRNIQPDLRQRRRSDGTIFFDDVYTLFSNPPVMSHAIDPGGIWVFAVQVQNDGDTTDDITVNGPAYSSGIRTRYVVGWYDVSAAVGASGFTFHDVPPGEVITFGLRFEAPPEASPGTWLEVVLNARSANDSNAVDREGFRVDVSTPG